MNAALHTTTVTGTLKDRYSEVKDRIDAAARRSGRTGESIVLVAVSKYADPEQIRELVLLGQRDFGENHVQQLLQRAAIIDEWVQRHRAMPSTPWPGPAVNPRLAPHLAPTGDSPVRWHMIGHLQRNKVRKVVETCRLVHSVDSLRLAEELQLVAAKMQHDAERMSASRAARSGAAGRIDPNAPVVDVLLQVNIAGESQKSGCSVPAALHLAEQIDTMIQLRLRGIMIMAPYSANPEDSRRHFANGRELFEEIRDAGIAAAHFNILSMGMSGDYEIAIEEGANIVRVGSAVFGEPRNAPAEPGAEPHDTHDEPPDE